MYPNAVHSTYSTEESNSSLYYDYNNRPTDTPDRSPHS